MTTSTPPSCPTPKRSIEIVEIPHEIQHGFMRRVVQVDGFNLITAADPDVMLGRIREMFEYLNDRQVSIESL
jgi:hypothetical protein